MQKNHQTNASSVERKPTDAKKKWNNQRSAANTTSNSPISTQTKPNPYWNGYPVEEDIERAVFEAVQILGPQGRIVYGESHINYNVRVRVGKMGIIWYGDLTGQELEKLDTLAVVVGQTVEVAVS